MGSSSLPTRWTANARSTSSENSKFENKCAGLEGNDTISIVNSWLTWLKYKRADGGVKGFHECFVLLLNEWSALGNLLLPRDTLLQFSLDAVKAVVESESDPSRKFLEDRKSGSAEFEAIKQQYERMLKHLPSSQLADEWKKQVGIDDEPKSDSMDVEPTE